MNTNISASVICVNPIGILDDLLPISDLIDSLHFDIMDGHYVPRFGIFPEVVGAIRNHIDLPCDFHLMVNDIDFTLSQFSPHFRKNDCISFHVDGNEKDVFRLAEKIVAMGLRVRLVVNLATPIQNLTRMTDTGLIEGLLFMGINPGVLPSGAYPHLVERGLKEFKSITQAELTTYQIDGGVSLQSAQSLSTAGITDFVCGSSTIFKKNVYENFPKEAWGEQFRQNIITFRHMVGSA